MSRLSGLLQLQAVDVRLAQHQALLAALPEEAERAQVLTVRARTAAAAAAVQAELDRITARQGEHEAEVARLVGKADADEKRLYGGSITSPKDAEAMTHEVATLRRLAGEQEDLILELMEEAEPLNEQMAELQTEIRGHDERVAGLEQRIAERTVELNGLIETATGQRSEMVAQLDADALAVYDDRCRRLAPEPAVGTIDGATCTACGLLLPAAEVEQVRNAGDDDIVDCSECGALLVKAAA